MPTSHDTAPLPGVAARLLRRLPGPLRTGIPLVIDAVKRWSDDDGAQLGAAIAFYTMFAMAPVLVVAIAIAGAVFGREAATGQIVGQIEGLVGESAARGIQGMIEAAWRDPDGLLAGSLAIGTLLVGASSVFAQLRVALNRIGRVPPPTSGLSAFVRARLVGVALVLGFGFLAIASLLLSAGMAALGAYLSDRYPALAPSLAALDVLVSTGVLTLAFGALLRWLPDHPASKRAVWLGAVASAVLFSVGKHLIGLYLARASVASSYGAAGSFVVVMLWVYYSAQILLYGAALGAVHDDRERARRGDEPAALAPSRGPAAPRSPAARRL